MADGAGPSDAGPAGPGPAPTGPVALLRQQFSAETVTALRHAVAAQVAGAGLSGSSADDLVVAVHELVTNAVRHGGGSGRLELRLIADTLVCEVVDHGGTADSLPVQLPQADTPGGRGLWLAHHLTQGLMLTQRPDGVTASVSVCLTSATAPSDQPSADPAGGNVDTSPTAREQP
ncbi:ATP-binding protein [Actinoplanes sp. NPDC051475]|uniref:ATP-binding protein n=1 Tax=Actinoplanes sp. NPDC051475 TaxID=3157225 RepID=UPI00344CA6BD